MTESFQEIFKAVDAEFVNFRYAQDTEDNHSMFIQAIALKLGVEAFASRFMYRGVTVQFERSPLRVHLSYSEIWYPPVDPFEIATGAYARVKR